LVFQYLKARPLLCIRYGGISGSSLFAILSPPSSPRTSAAHILHRGPRLLCRLGEIVRRGPAWLLNFTRMSDTNDSPKAAGETATADPQSSLLSTDQDWKIFEAFTKLIWDVTNFYARGITFFLAINAVVFGYVLKAEIAGITKSMVSIYGLATSALFLLCSIAFFRYVQGISRTVQTCVLSGSPELIKHYGMARNAARGRFLFATFAIGSVTLIVLMIAAYIVLLVY
jgi:hypothetical protein